MSAFEGHYKNAQYRYFSVGDSTTNYFPTSYQVSTSVELTTVMVSGGIPSTQLKVLAHSGGQK